jgi:molecular chaperone DnaK
MQDVDILGIDLGTTNSAIALWAPDSGTRILPNRAGDNLTRSVVYYEPGGSAPLVGAAAEAHLRDRPDSVVYSLKRFMGRTGSDDAVADDARDVTYEIEQNERRKLVVHVGERLLVPPEISAQVLRALAADAAAALGRPVTRAVITVPAYFEEPQRQATQEAGRLAGLEVPRLISEPTAAALAYGLGSEPQTVAVYDLGGGTFDFSLLRVEHGLFRVRSTTGDTHLGGDDFDRKVVGWIEAECRRAHGDGPAGDPRTRSALREAAQRAKEALTDADRTTIDLPELRTAGGTTVALSADLDRTTFERLIQPLVDRTLDKCQKLLVDDRTAASEVDRLLLVGGQTRTPAIRRGLQERFGWEPMDGVDPDEAVARGAAVLGARLCGHLKNRVQLWDVTPLPLGIKLDSGAFEPIIRANQQIPVKVWRRGPDGFTTRRDGQTRVVFQVYQGERPRADDNTFVGDVALELATVRASGEHRIDCLFEVDHDGILHVRAEEADADGSPVEARFDRSYQLSEAEIAAQRRAAEEHRAEDADQLRRFAIQDRLARLRGSDVDDDRVARAEQALQADDLDKAEAVLGDIDA